MIAFDIHTIQILMSDIADRVYSLSTKPWGEGERDEPLHRLQKLTVQARADEHIFTQAVHRKLPLNRGHIRIEIGFKTVR